MLASLIIPTYHRDADLVRTLQSVLNQNDDFELLVVDQSATHNPDTTSFLHSIKDPRFRYFRITPPSLPGARNFGIDHSSGEVIIFIDDDTELEPGFVVAHTNQYTDPTIGAVAGRIRGQSEPPSDTLNRLKWHGFRRGSFDYPWGSWSELVRGCNMSFRRDVLASIGGFDSRFVGNAYREDTDAAYSVREHGWRVWYTPQASLIHNEAQSGGCREGGAYVHDALFYQNSCLFMIKHRQYLMMAAYASIHTATAIYRRDWKYGSALWRGVWQARRVAHAPMVPKSVAVG